MVVSNMFYSSREMHFDFAIYLSLLYSKGFLVIFFLLPYTVLLNFLPDISSSDTFTSSHLHHQHFPHQQAQSGHSLTTLARDEPSVRVAAAIYRYKPNDWKLELKLSRAKTDAGGKFLLTSKAS